MALDEYGYNVTDKSNDEDWDATDYKFLYEDSAGGTFGRDNSQATITYMCDYNYVTQFLDVVMGKTVFTGGGISRSADGGTFDDSSGSLPEEHPIFDNFFAASAEMTPEGIRANYGGDGPFWSKSKVTVVFRPPTYNVLGDDEVSHEYERFTSVITEGSAEFQTSTGFFKFVSDPNHRLLDITPGQTVVASRQIYTWMQIPVATRSDGKPDLARVPNFGTIQGLQGKLNSVDFDGNAPGTVLFTSWSSKLVLPQTASSGNYYWDISYTFGIRDYGDSTTPVVTGEGIGWNYAYNPLLKEWDLYTTDGTTSGGTNYLYGDLNSLFTV